MISLALLLACSQAFDEEQLGAGVEDWGGPAGGFFMLTPVGSPDSPALMIEALSDVGQVAAWELRYGETWSTAQVLGQYPAFVDGDGYHVEQSLIVPNPVEVGTTVDGTAITDRGELETWYGVFPDAIQVSVGGGPFKGSAAFSAGVGPLRLEYQGDTWEIVYYE